ncbi:MAG: bifunctional phosphoribosylaminoimidazolecarboxamide formyltransferase/IMP cyclohydrolase [Acidimicrobiales bacterium]|nr:bifunctional phosphoribosylaminoimidazolecarboxamide formyltransferase/IMP cyclohydrolase [Acidimicrobiales bacterium]MCB9393521.1 bifunctional phosphoribosylaminoimidazolecarboxamide formyltransferase/IMP cyclohydrolase [Acidimicrobiaceae bacterium]
MPLALLSVYDKTGIVELAAALHELGWSIVSSGGTATAITAAGLPATDLADLTGVPAILDHRVVTLHPKVHGGLLADPTKPAHQADMAEYGISPIDLLVVNLYPFSSNPSIELIDIGGPAMVRAAAKNHHHVAVVVNPADYRPVVDEVRDHGAITPATRRRLARDAFATITAYDAQIANWFDASGDHLGDGAGDPLPAGLQLSLTRRQVLRYGENPHQQGARYVVDGGRSWWDDMVQHGGKELSYLNLYDTEAAWKLVHRFDDPACVIVKHANPCGVAVAADVTTAYVRANACDPVSAFGGIVALNREVTAELAEALAPVFTEVVVAPSYTPEALEVFARKGNLRVLSGPQPYGAALDLRSIDGGLLVQQAATVDLDRSHWRVVTTAQPTADQLDDLAFAWTVCAAVSSNAIVYAKDGQAYGIGAGQQNRLDSARIAAERSAGRANGGVCASDAFFPFRDGLDAAAAAGIRAVIQPGGSVRDGEVIAAADEHGIAMVFTGERHFRH